LREQRIYKSKLIFYIIDYNFDNTDDLFIL